MAKFKELSKEKVSVIENRISDFWEDIDILKETIDNREGKENFVFYEGPPTANGNPGIHHVLARVLKDTVCKYKTMDGYRVLRKAGWDTHGLPVEIEVEKQLGLANKTEIETYGIDKFNQKCKESVFTYEHKFREMTKKMGYFIDLDNPYVTLNNDFIETEWWILNKFFEEGMIYEGHKILPYCSRCGTGLASHEVAQGYKEIKSETVIVPMKVKDKDEYLLVWTTTPWTLISNVAIAVNPNSNYIKAESKGFVFYVASDLANRVLGDDFTVLEELKGTDLEYLEYEQLLPFLPVDKKAFFVVLADYVTTDDGTGLVHIAPAFGEDDYQVGRKYNLPVLNPVAESGKYTEGPWEGTFVMDADLDIIKWLKANNKLFKKERVPHNYPHCWRCGTPLLYYAKPSWYIEVTKMKEMLIENNNGVNWFPDYVGEKRFGNWLDNLNDWAISRTRYWGTPLNIWRCECGHLESVKSRKDLVEKAIEDIDESIELHRPYVDDVHITCPKCNKPMTRVKEVIDCWFDSGSMPFSQYHYPFENKDFVENEQFPADFICEGIDQTRGWFYTLLAISTFVMGKAPYKNVLVNDLLLDKNGQKMSKSKGNAVDPFALFDTYGADVVRWYLLYVSPAWTPTKFDEDGLKEVQSKFFNTIKNVYNFFVLYANTDDLNPNDFFIEYNERPEIDLWLLSKYNKLIKEVRENMDVFDLTRSVRKIQYFVNEDLSNWYIRRNRRRFWGSELNDDKKSVYNTTYEVLVGITKLIAPFIPFLAEELYTNLTNEKSVHLSDLPVVNDTLINEHIEERMDLIQQLISLGRSAREEASIKVRQPINKIIIDGKYFDLIGDLAPLMKEELNVKVVDFENNLDKYMNYSVKPNFKIAGPIFGKNMGLFNKELQSRDASELINTLKEGSINITLNDTTYEVTNDLVQTNISSKEGFNVQMYKNLFVILDTTLSTELINEGLARELVSKIQQLRKSSGFEVTDKIEISYASDEEIDVVFDIFSDYIKKETLAKSITKVDGLDQVYKINGHDTYLTVTKIK